MLPRLIRTQNLGGIGPGLTGRLNLLLVCAGLVVTAWATSLIPFDRISAPSANVIAEDLMDQNLQRVATSALGQKRGTVIVIDPQTGRIRAVVNPELAFQESLPPGSTIKPFTTLAALRSNLIDEDSRTACREEYSFEDYHTVCSHPRGLHPLNPTDAIAYSCNYYFGRLGERLNESSFVSTLNEFGFGRKTGVNVDNESQGRLQRNGWRSRNAIGESNSVLATPIQIINAYSALVNGGHLLTPRLASSRGFVGKRQSDLVIDDGQRLMIVKGMRGAVRYGTAETAGLYKLPTYIFGKTGTATQLDGFRSQGWFIGFASTPEAGAADSETSPSRVRLAVLVFLAKAHGSEAAEVARPIFEEFSNHQNPTASALSSLEITRPESSSPEFVRVRSVSDEVTESLPLEDYLRSVVATEGSTENELEALKALAIAARTYAIRNKGRHQKDGYDFCSTTHCQRYRSIKPVSDGSVSKVIAEAVATTQGEVLQDSGGQIVDSYFSASCGGATANIATLWGSAAPPYLRGVRDEACDSEPHNNWTDLISEVQLLKALQSDPRTNVGPRLSRVDVIKRDQSNRAELISIQGDRSTTIKGWEFKLIVGRALGWNVLKSSRFEVARSGPNFVFRGKGFGHGLGLCQEGAHVMASQGANYRQILEKYFPTTHLARNLRPKGSADLLWSNSAQFEMRRPGVGCLVSGVRCQELSARRLVTFSAGHDFSFRHPTPEPRYQPRQSLKSEGFRIDYPGGTDRREIERLFGILRSMRSSLVSRVAVAGLRPQIPSLEIFFNDTTGNFVGRTGQPPWAAAATKDHRIELQPLATLKRRGVLETTLKHELVHVLVDALGPNAPRWLAEGLAINFAGEGPLVTRYQPRQKMTLQEIEHRLQNPRSADDMKAAYAAAYNEVRALIAKEGEVGVWRKVAGS